MEVYFSDHFCSIPAVIQFASFHMILSNIIDNSNGISQHDNSNENQSILSNFIIFVQSLRMKLLYCCLYCKKLLNFIIFGMVKYIQNYVLYESIGSGVYGKVYRALNNTDKKEYAIKVIPINKFKQNKKLQECTVNQINILTNIEQHPNIIRYYDMLKTSNNFYFIYEYCNGGTLENLLAKQIKLSEQQTMLIFKQLLQAFQVLNKYNIMHRDMKPDNIFFHNGVIKLGDFGFCKNLNSPEEMTKTMLGSPIYMAPEVLKGEIYSNKADIWSLGVVIFEMIYGVCPFQSNSIANLIEVLNTKDLHFPGPISPFLKNLITRMLTKDPFRRISWIQLFQIRINNQGEVQNERQRGISSLTDAKTMQEVPLIVSNKQINIGKSDPYIDQPARDFKKNRNNNVTPINVNMGSAMSYGSSPVPTVNSPTLAPTPPPSIPSNSNPNMMTPTNKFTAQPSQNNKTTANKQNLIPEEHRMVMEGVRLAMQIVQAKLPNHLGYAHLLLNKSISLLAELTSKGLKGEVLDVLELEGREIEIERELISSKMFAYELKGLEDWRKYLRGKFFEEDGTILFWYKMVTYLNGSYNSYSINQVQPAEIVKQILY